MSETLDVVEEYNAMYKLAEELADKEMQRMNKVGSEMDRFKAEINKTEMIDKHILNMITIHGVIHGDNSNRDS